MRNTFKKGLSVLLALVLLFGSVAIGGDGIGQFLNSLAMTAQASTNGHTQAEAVAWIQARGDEGWWQDVDGVYGCQCVDLIYKYYQYLVGSHVGGNGYNYVNNSLPAGWWRDNTPSPGAIVVWGANKYNGSYNVGEYGHVGLVRAVSGNTIYTVETNLVSPYDGASGRSNAKHQTRAADYASCYIHPDFPSHTCDYNASATITKAPTKTATGTRVRTCSCGKTDTQTIPAIPYTTDLAEGIYTITSKNREGLRIASNDTQNYNVFAWNNPGNDCYWLFRKNSDGTYTIESAYFDGYVLDVVSGKMVNGANIQIYQSNGTDAQKFYVIPDGNYYRLVVKKSYLTVDLHNGETNDGTNIKQWEDNGGSAQRWTLTRSNPPLNLSSTSVTVNEGSSKTVNCTCGRETYGQSFSYSIANSSVCSASWGSWNGMTCPLTITGKAGGTTTITVTLKDTDTGIVYNTKTITVTVPDTTKPTVSISATNNAAASQTATLSLSDNVGLAGYYWGTSSSYSSNTYATVSGTSKSVSKTVSEPGTYYLTAKDAAGNVSSTVSKTFYRTTLNPGIGSVSPTSVITASGNSFALPTPTRTGYTFKNWNTNSGGTGTAYYSGSSYKPTGNSTLYAQWTANTYTVSFNANGGSGAPASQTKTYGQTLTLSSTKPTRTGYTFKNWNTKADGSGTSYAAGASYTTNAAVTLYAQWTAKTYTVSFNANGGSGAPASQTKTYGQTLTLSSTKPTRTGYTFKNWNTKADGSGTSYAAGASYTANAAVTLYAQWQKNEATLQSISVKTNPTKTTYTVGETLNTAGLTLTATYSDKSTQTITSGFTCTPTKLDVAGFRTITVSYGGKTATFGVTVNNPASTQGKVKAVSVSDVSIYYKSSTTLRPSVTADEGVKYTVKYESSNPNVASVDANGRVYGNHRGAAIITCTVTDEFGNEVKASCVVTVDYSLWQWIIIILLFGWLWY